jgi:hypothetical protein
MKDALIISARPVIFATLSVCIGCVVKYNDDNNIK